MFTRKLWPYVRRFVPLSLYPSLGYLHRLDEAWSIRRLARADRRYLASHDARDIPPPHMRFRVFGECDVKQYVAGSEDSYRCLESALEQCGRSFQEFRTVLDFGCGCGRTLRILRGGAPGLSIFATDVDATAVNWCREHFDFAQCDVNGELPPLPHRDGTFDLIWTISVFTHLDEKRQFLWLAELRRVMQPGGILLATVHGEFFWAGLPARTVDDLRSHGFLFARTNVDRGALPDWYQTAWHTREYVEREWGRYFKILAYVPRGMHNRQDLVVVQRMPA